ncbi:MAG: 2Fe-2S iron-sulfur cluster binding domain-containing protein [Thermoleophilia bacterium]|nr:2Fe-2S iron-sulfur cluster binding domain-containing protein [Thermoleophilia bacterium]
MEIELIVNGRPVAARLEPQQLLLDFLRDDLGLTGTKRSCDVQVCGACTVLLDGLPVSSCCTLAVEAHGRDVLTIEGLAERDEFAAIERAFARHAAVQCGYCTPGLVLTIHALLAEGALATEDGIRRNLAGNLCRCTGYKAIVEAVRELAGTGNP